MAPLDSSPTQAMLDATLFYMEQYCLLCLEMVSQASYYTYEQKEITHTLYESFWIFHALIQNITIYHPDIVRRTTQCNDPALPSHTLDRMKKIRYLLQKLRQHLRTFSFLDPDQKCSILLQMLLHQEILNIKIAKPFHNKTSPPWINPILSNKKI
ncbi:hypothetical protein [Bacillus sp. C30]|uniref:hypothetical protein n=1 Tax=Bacillus sp. C30 TaxID=1387733 RepID=UPI00349F22DF